jgi:predicted RNase H-like HicB family nuclease
MGLKEVLEPGEDGGFVAHVPALRGRWPQVTTRDEAVEIVKEAIKAWLEVEQGEADTSDKGGQIELVKVPSRGDWIQVPKLPVISGRQARRALPPLGPRRVAKPWPEEPDADSRLSGSARGEAIESSLPYLEPSRARGRSLA